MEAYQKDMICKMKKYEYKSIEIASLKFKYAYKQFQEAGKEGWELVNVIPVSNVVMFTKVPVTKAIIGYFKREIK